MFNFRDLFKRGAVVAAAAFAAVFPAGAITLDVAATKAAVLAVITAGFAVAVSAAWELLGQLFDRAKGYFPADPEAIALLDQAAKLLNEARAGLR